MPSRVLARHLTLLLAAILTTAPCVHGQDAKADVTNRVNALIVRTKVTADRTGIVTPGTVVKLGKDGLLLSSVAFGAAPTNTYKDGKISVGFGATMAWGLLLPPNTPPSSVPQRKFVAGENVWVTDYKVANDEVIFQFYSDPMPDQRYYGQLKFPLNKKNFPPADDVMKTIAEVMTVDSSAAAAPTAAPAAAPATPPPAMAPIAPPPPPPDMAPAPPKTIALGQTKDQVVAMFGQPQKVVKLVDREIDYFPDMKVTFTGGRVTDIH